MDIKTQTQVTWLARAFVMTTSSYEYCSNASLLAVLGNSWCDVAVQTFGEMGVDEKNWLEFLQSIYAQT